MREAGHTLLEATLVLGLMGILSCLGAATLDLRGPALALLPLELRGALDQAFLLARARGSDVRVALGGPGGDVAPVILPRGVRWGLPGPSVPIPDGMDPPRRAHRTGAAHPILTVTPRGTATASAWFLTDGRDALCMRLSGEGQLHLLRWRWERRAWEPA
jgi:hypothetical protein